MKGRRAWREAGVPQAATQAARLSATPQVSPRRRALPVARAWPRARGMMARPGAPLILTVPWPRRGAKFPANSDLGGAIQCH